VCIFVGLECSLVEYGELSKLYILLEVCPSCKDKVEIKCRLYCWKTPIELNLYSSLTLGTLNKIKLMFMLNLNMG